MIIDQVSNIRTYLGIHPNLDTAIRAIEEKQYLQWEPGRHEIDGNDVYCNAVRINYAKENIWERHEGYLDIHISLDGQESIRYCDRERVHGWSDYDPKGDCATAPFSEVGIVIPMTEGKFAICFPQDAHMPGLGEDGKSGRKVIFKVKY